MRGVILAGGTGSRLLPLTRHLNKHPLTVGDRPMILHPYGALVGAGVHEVSLESGPGDLDALAAALPAGPLRLTLFEQERPLGIAHALATTGIYFYDARVFEYIDKLTPSARGEYEIAHVNTRYLQAGQMSWGVLEGNWTDAGTHASLARARAVVARR